MAKPKVITAHKKNPGGRPSKFGSVNKEAVQLMAERGFTDDEMRKCLHVSEKTWTNWKKKHKDFYESLRDWKAVADNEVERSLFERAKGYTHPEEKIFQAEGRIIRADTTKHYPPDTAAAFIWLKNRKPAEWRDKSFVETKTSFKMSDVDTDGLTEQEMVDVMMGRVSVDQIREQHAKRQSQ